MTMSSLTINQEKQLRAARVAAAAPPPVILKSVSDGANGLSCEHVTAIPQSDYVALADAVREWRTLKGAGSTREVVEKRKSLLDEIDRCVAAIDATPAQAVNSGGQ
jgi:hypothetical protein